MPSAEASLANLEIARVRHRPWRPWRSPQESWQIRHLVWQWFIFRGPKWSERMLARRLGVHHHYVQKLVREFESDPAKMWREWRECGFYVATFKDLLEARDRTRQMAERGLLRPLRRSRWGDRKPEFQHKLMWPSSFRISREIPVWATPAYGLLLCQ